MIKILFQFWVLFSSLTVFINGEWYTALTSNIDDTTFHYYSDVWYNSTPFNTKYSTTKNALFEAYSTIYVEKVRISMDGTTDKSCGTRCTFTFSLPESYAGRFTLMELVTTDGGIDMTDERDIAWINTNANHFKFQGSSSSYYDCYYTHEMAFNYGNYERTRDRYRERPRVRIGIMMSFYHTNGEWRAAEGIGLTYGYSRQWTDNVGSGRVESYYPYLFRPAKVEVYGTTKRVDLESSYTSAKIDKYGRYPVLATNFNSSLQDSSAPRNTILFSFRLKRKSRSMNKQIFRIGTSLTLGSLWTYTQSEGSSQPYYDGRHWYHYQASTYNPSEGVNSIESCFTVGKWHQMAFTTDMNRRTVWMDGFPMVGNPYYRGSRTLSSNEELFQLGNSNGAIIAEISDFRIYQRELCREEILNISKDWIYYHKGCGDGERDLDEGCDDGNRIDGDGCSAHCEIEAGYICVGGNSTSIVPDKCLKGGHSLTLDFDNYSSPMDASSIFIPHSKYQFSVDLGWPGWDMTGRYSGGDAINMELGSSALSLGTCSSSSQGCCDNTFGKMIGGVRNCGINCVLSRSFTDLPSHNYIRVTVQIAFVDAWSNQWIFMFADNQLRFRVQKTSVSLPVHSTEACLPTVGGGSNVCRVSYCSSSSYADDLATYNIYFYHNKSTLDLKFTNTLNSATNRAVGFTYLTMELGTSDTLVFQTEGAGTLRIGEQYSSVPGGKGLSIRNNAFPSYNARTGSAYSHVMMLGHEILSPISFLEFKYNLYRIPFVYGGFYVTIIRTNPGDTDPLFEYNLQNCQTSMPSESDSCGIVKFYRICYDSTYEPSQYSQFSSNYCDERQFSNLGSWYSERVDIGEKFKYKYGFTEGAKVGQFHVQFGVYGDYYGNYRDVEVYIDDVKISTPSVQYPTCPQLDVTATSTASTFVIGGDSGALTGSTVAGKWNVAKLDPQTHAPLTPIYNMNNTEFHHFVSELEYGMLVMYSHTGPVVCDEPSPTAYTLCDTALGMIGGTAVTFTISSDSVSVAGIGSAGVGVGNMPFQASLWSDNGMASVTSYIGCHSRNTSIGENTVAEAKIGPPLAEGSNTRYFVDSTSFGFVGCYVRGSESELFGYGYDNGYSLTSGSCALVCHDAGFLYSRVYRTECVCSDSYGQAVTVSERNFPVSDTGYVSAEYCWNINTRLSPSSYWNWGCRGDYSQLCAGYTYGAWYQARSSSAFPSTYPVSIICENAASSTCNNAFDFNINTYYRSTNIILNTNYTITLDLQNNFIIDSVRVHTGNLYLKSYELLCGKVDTSTIVYSSYGVVKDATFESNNVNIVNIEAHGWSCQYLKLQLLSSSGSYFHIRDIRINYYPLTMLKQRGDMFASTFTQSYYSFSRTPYYRANSYANSILPVVEADHMMSVDIRTGQLWLARARFDYEALTSYHVRVVARIQESNSGWFQMSNIKNFVELQHNVSGIPWNIRVNVQVLSGANQGYIFDATGSIMIDGSEVGSVTYGNIDYPETYGGLLFAYNENTVRLWAPSGVNGYIINVGGGWGQKNLQSESTANVRVKASAGTSPQYDTGWTSMRSQSSNPDDIQRDFPHPISDIEHAVVKVYYRAKTGPNQGFIFEAVGASQADDDGGSYGGVVFGYTETYVRVFLPNNTDSSSDNCPMGSNGFSLTSGTNICQDCSSLGGYPCTHKDGYAVYVPSGFGGGRYTQRSHEIDVRIKIWSSTYVKPAFMSEGIGLTSNGVAYNEYYHYATSSIDRVNIIVRGNSISPNWYSPGVTAAHGTDIRPRVYGGVIYAYNGNSVRLWAPAQSLNNMWHAYGQASSIGDGWGNGQNVVNSQAVTVKMMLFYSNEKSAFDQLDTAGLSITIENNNEMPDIQASDFSILENTHSEGYELGQMTARDVDGDQLTSYTIIAGNVDDAFRMDSNGTIILNNPKAINYQLRQNFSLQVAVSDGTLSDIGNVFIEVLYKNAVPVIHPPYGREIRELSSASTEVGLPLNASNREPIQSILFTLLPEGNYRDAFAISTCSGQIFVFNPDAIDYENITGFSSFNLSVMVTDDGANAGNRTYSIPITVLNRNEPPYWDNQFSLVLNVTENVPVGTQILPSLSQWCADVDYGDIHYFTVLNVASASEYDVSDYFRVDNMTGIVYVNKANVLDYEAGLEYTLAIRCTDDNLQEEQIPPNLYSDQAIIITINDANDPPEFYHVSLSQSLKENSPAMTLLSGSPLIVTDQDVSDYSYFTLVENYGNPGMFEVDTVTGNVYQVSYSFDYEQIQSVQIRVMATDHGWLVNNKTAPPQSTIATLNITILDVNEAPSFIPSNFTMTEVTTMSPLKVGNKVATVNGSDPDTVAKQTLTFQITGSSPAGASSFFKIESSGQRLSANLLVNGALSYEVYKQITLYFTVRDNGGDPNNPSSPGLTSSGQMVVTITDLNDPPVLACKTTPSLCIFSVSENTGSGYVVGQILGSDEDGESLTYSFVNPSNQFSQRFSLNPATGEISVALQSVYTLDYEVADSYTFTVMTTDSSTRPGGVGTDQAVYTISLLDVPEAPYFTGSKTLEFGVSESASIGTSVGSSLSNYWTDQDFGAVLEYFTLLTMTVYPDTGGGVTTAPSIFRIDSSSGQLYLIEKPQIAGYGVDDELICNVTISDGVFNISSIVRVVVQDSNTPPILPTTNCTIPENVVGPYIICNLNATDAEGDIIDYKLKSSGTSGSRFQLTSDGWLSLASGKSFNYEVQSSYSIRVIVSDVVKYPQSTESTVNVFVLDQNDPPVIFPTGFSIFENHSLGTLQQSTAMVFTDEDNDGLLCSSYGSGSTSFLIHEVNNGYWAGSMTSTLSAEESASSNITLSTNLLLHYVYVTLQLDPLSSTLSYASNIEITIIDVSSQSLVLSTWPSSWNTAKKGIYFNAPNVLSSALTGSGPWKIGVRNRGLIGSGSVKYDLKFEFVFQGRDSWISAPSTACFLGLISPLDYDTIPQFKVQEQVTDGKATVRANITINVLNVNEPPQIGSNFTLYVDENSIAGTTLTDSLGKSSITAMDPENNELSFSIISGDSNHVFEIQVIQSTAPVSFLIRVASGATLDFESVPSYTLVVQVVEKSTPDHYKTNTTVTVMIRNLNDVSVASVKNLANDAFNRTNAPLQTSGGDIIQILGTDFGMKSYVEAVVVTYGPTGTEYTAQSCAVQPGNNVEIRCISSAGVGLMHVWKVQIASSGHSFVTTFVSGIMTNYYRPILYNTTNVNMYGEDYSTVGGETVRLMGGEMGSSTTSIGSNLYHFSGYATLRTFGTQFYLQDPMEEGLHKCRSALNFYLSSIGDTVRIVSDTCPSAGTISMTVRQKFSLGGVSLTPSSVSSSPCSFDRTTDSDWSSADELGQNIDYQSVNDDVFVPGAMLVVSTSTTSGMAAKACSADTVWRVYVSGVPRMYYSNFEVSYETVNSTSYSGGTTVVSLSGGFALMTSGCTFQSKGIVNCLTSDGVGYGYRARYVVAGHLSDELLQSESLINYHEPVMLSLNGSSSSLIFDTRGYTSSTPDVVYLRVLFAGSNAAYSAYGSGFVRYGSVNSNMTFVNDVFYTASCTVGASTWSSDVNGYLYCRSNGVCRKEYVYMLTCHLSSGTGGHHLWMMSVGGQETGYASTTTSYKPPVLQYMSPDQWPFSDTAGGDTVILSGDQFGPVSGLSSISGMITAYYGGESQFETNTLFETRENSCSVTSAHQVITCIVGVGTGKNHSWYVVVNGQSSNTYQARSSYTPPILVDFAIYNHTNSPEGLPESVSSFSTKGGQLVEIIGRNFGPLYSPLKYNAPIEATAMYAASSEEEYVWEYENCTVVIPHTHMVCETTVGVGSGLKWNIRIDNQTNTVPTTSYAAPELFLVEGVGFNLEEGINTRGGQQIRLHGKNFGPDLTFVEIISFGPTGGEYVLYDARSSKFDCSFITPHEVFSCVVPEGFGRNHMFSIIVGGQKLQSPITMNNTISYKAPMISSITPLNGTTQGGYTIVIRGSNFGPIVGAVLSFWGVVYSNSPMTYVSHEQIKFVVPEGQGVDRELSIGQKSSWCMSACEQFSSAYHFDYRPPQLDRLIFSDSSISGYSNLTMYGVVQTSKPNINGGSFGSAQTAQHINDHGEVSEFYNNAWIFPYNVTTSYIDSQLTAMFQLLASGYTFSSITNNVSVQLCAVTPEYGGHWTHNSVNCLVESTNGTVVIASYDALAGIYQRSEPFLFREKSPVVYSPITLTSPFPDDSPFPTTGGFTLTLTGTYFGALTTIGAIPEALDVLLYLEGYMDMVKCRDVKIVSPTNSNQESTISCQIPPGQGKNVAVIVRKGGDGSKLMSDYGTGENCKTCVTFDPPTISHFSSSPNTASIRRSLAASSFPVYAPTTGIQTLVFFGSNFGLPGGAVVRIAGTPLQETGHHFHNNMTVVLGEGVGINLQLSIQVANHDPVVATITGQPFMVHYLPPSVSSSSQYLLHTEGNEQLVISGNNFGTSVPGAFNVSVNVAELVGVQDNSNYSGSVTLDGSGLLLTSWNHTNIICMTSEGRGGTGKSLLVEAGGQQGTLTGFSYYTPVITSISTDHAPTSGLDNAGSPIAMTLYGRDFGSSTANKYVSFGSNTILASELNSTHWTCDFYIPEGQGANIPISITVEGQISNTVYFSYDPPLLVSMTPRIGSTSACSNWESQQSYLRRLDSDPTATRKCYTKELVTITGTSFGTVGMKITVDNDLVCETDGDGKVISSWNCLFCDADPTVHNTCYQSHNKIVIWAPQSYGLYLPVVLTVDGRRDAASTPVNYSYFPPEITSSNPGTVSQGSDYINAKGQALSIYGTNLGGSQSWVSINFTGITTKGEHVMKSCDNAKWVSGATNYNDGFPYLTCTMPSDVVGGKNMTIHVAEQTVNVPVLKNVQNSIFVSACKTEYDSNFVPTTYYGLRYYNEFCLECPTGALCKQNEYQVDPKSDEGFWLTYYDVNSQEAKDQCDKFRRPPLSSRDTCPVFLACAPAEACLGANTCEDPYTFVLDQCIEERQKHALSKYNNNTCWTNYDCNKGAEVCKWNQPERCSYCDIIPGSDTPGTCVCTAAPQCSMCKINEYYRVNGKCEPCPQNVLILIILFATALLTFVVASYILNKYKFNLSFVAIGFDYFQVLAIFASSDIVWPPIVIKMFSISFFFSFDINITAPECAYPDITYEQKWYVSMAMPFFGGAVFFMMFVAKLIHKYIWRHKRGWTALTKHGNQLIAMFVIMLYYLYLPLLRKALEILNCNPLEPSDGHVYTDWTSPNCGTGYCRCWDKRSDPQMQLVPWAMLSLVIYGVGYPCYVGYVIWKNHDLIKEDQLLRAMNTGDTRATNPLAYDVRKKYHKLYYHFKPGKTYWMIYVLIRKFWIAIAALIFRTNPTFQMSFILLILFVCYVLQVQHRPFMSTVERESELERHKAKVEEARTRQENGDKLDDGMMLHLKIQRIIDTVEQKDEVLNKRTHGKRVTNLDSETPKLTAEQVKNFFWDFNTVELYLLGCAIFVCISGIMFESESYSSNSGMKQSFLLLTFLVMMVIISSLIYFFVVFMSEVLTTFGYNTTGWFEMFMSETYRKKEEIQVAQMELRNLETLDNPMNVKVQNDDDKLRKEMEMAKLADENEKLMKQVSDLKKKEQLQRMSSFGTTNPMMQNPKKIKKKGTFETKTSGENFNFDEKDVNDML